MKRVFVVVVAAIMLCGCGSDSGFTVNGKSGDKDGQAVLSYTDATDEELCDTVAMTAGTFRFKGSVDDVYQAVVKVLPDGEMPISAALYLENTDIEFSMDPENSVDFGPQTGRVCEHPTVTGGRNNAFIGAMNEAQAAVDSLPEYAEYLAARTELSKADRSDRDAYHALYAEFRNRYGETMKAYAEAKAAASVGCVKAHPECEAAAIQYMFYKNDASLEEMESVYETFTPTVQKSFLCKPLAEEITALKATSPGAQAPDFTLKDREGKDVTMSSLRGSYLIIDFWASWCGPCRAGMPAMKELYARYHDKGLEILGVSDDSDHDKWTAALDEDQLPWINVVDEFPSKSRSARVISSYGVHYIPSYFLLDRDGKVIGKMSHDEIEAKLAELLGE